MGLLPRLHDFDVPTLEPGLDFRSGQCAIQGMAIAIVCGKACPTFGSDVPAADDMLDIAAIRQIALKPVRIHFERGGFGPCTPVHGNFFRSIGTRQQFGSTVFSFDSTVAGSEFNALRNCRQFSLD